MLKRERKKEFKNNISHFQYDNVQDTFDSEDLLKMITINAAKNINLDKDLGTIKEGKFADLIVLDLNQANYFIHKLNSESVYPLIVQRTKSINIKKVFINGVNVFERN